MAVYGDQNKWKEVKEQMLKTYQKYKDTLYANWVEDSDSFEKSLSYNPIQYWLNTTDCLQIAAFTLGRGIVVFSKTLFNGKSYKQAAFLHLLRLSRLTTPSSIFYWITFISIW